MALTREKIEHICERARRTLSHNEREMKVFFLLYRTGQMKEALAEALPKLRRTKAGRLMQDFLGQMEEPAGPAFPGLVYYNPPRLLPFLGGEQVLAPILINIDETEDIAAAQQLVYHLFWHALNLLEEFRSARKTPETADYSQSQYILKPKYLKFKETRNNLIADIFGAFMTEFEQKSGLIGKLALRRAESAMEKRPGFLIEKYPYPLVAEACQLVFDDLKSVFTEADQLFPVAYKMASEVAATYGDEVIQQWRDFALPAQEMAWLDAPVDVILGNAVFTAEDPYVRTGAYMIAEMMGRAANPASEKNLYNAYARGDKNRELHVRACEEAFSRVLSRAATMNDPSAFFEEVKRQNKTLAEGNPVGWCAHAIAEAGKVFEQCLQTDQLTIEDVSEAFRKHLQTINWDDILKVSRTIITMHRDRKTFGLNEIAAALSHLEGVEEIIKTLRTSVKSDFFDANVTNVQRHKTMQSPVNLSFGPGTAKAEAEPDKEEAA
jgi:hypothetical protein